MITRGAEAAQRRAQLHWLLTQEEENQRQRHQGLGRPIISAALSDGTRGVLVGQRQFRGRWKTFPDFLMDYMKLQFESDWGNSELAKPAEERHPLLNLYQQVCAVQREALDAPNEVRHSRFTGAVSIYLGLTYDLYCVEHNARTQPVWERWLHKLRTKTDFAATSHEAMAAGAFARAGFMIDFENETDGTQKHVEFIATHPDTGRRFAVECKRRYSSEGSKPREVKHLNRAIEQNETGLILIAFIELDKPVQYARIDGFPMHMRGAVARLERHARSQQGQAQPPVYVILTNQPQNHFPNEVVGSVGYLHGFKIPELEFRERGPLEDLVAARDAHPEVHELLRSLNEHSHPPNTFDGHECRSDSGLKTPLDYYDFMHGTCEHTQRETLLKLMRDWPHQDMLHTLEQPELAKRYAIRWAMNLLHHQASQPSSDCRKQTSADQHQ